MPEAGKCRDGVAPQRLVVGVGEHPGEDSGELWAAELRDWLISLGVPSDYIRLIPGTQEADEITLVVGNRDELEQ